MSENITLSNLANLLNETSVVATINNNNAVITTAFTDVLSRSGTSPNQMTSNLDMNSNRVMNLPAPVNATEPARLQDLSTVSGGGTVSNIPTGGSAGASLVKNSSTNYDIGWSTNAADVTAGSNITVSGANPTSIAVSTSPSFTTPNLNVATATSINKVAITAPSTSATLTIANGKTLTANNTLSFTGTDSTTITFQGTDTYVGRTTSDTLTNKTISGASNTLSGVSLTTAVTGTLPIANGGTNDTGGAWTTYSPNVSAGTGVLTSASATGRFKTIGKTVFYEAKVTVTTNGTAGSFITITYPPGLGPQATNTYAMAGFNVVAGGLVAGNCGASTINIFKADGSYPGTDGAVVTLCGIYESV